MRSRLNKPVDGTQKLRLKKTIRLMSWRKLNKMKKRKLRRERVVKKRCSHKYLSKRLLMLFKIRQKRPSRR